MNLWTTGDFQPKDKNPQWQERHK